MEKMITKPTVELSISIVSHAQINLVENLLHEIAQHCQALSLELILTLNLDETLSFSVDTFPFPISVIRNSTPQGFANNHNQALRYATGQFYCVMNPDIRLNENPFPTLLDCLKDSSVGVAAPLVLNESGTMEDSARRFPTPLKILCKAIGGCKGNDYVVKDEAFFPDWVGGMFMLFRSEIFKKLSGFDQRYFLYYEDVDLCARLRLQGYEVAVCPQSKVIHQAQRSSHRNLKYMYWHLKSMARFFVSSVYWRIQCRKWI
jgi:N-acetylglucosaminyl-diphospho-decaprenol L-rhamnosyltransferase